MPQFSFDTLWAAGIWKLNNYSPCGKMTGAFIHEELHVCENLLELHVHDVDSSMHMFYFNKNTRLQDFCRAGDKTLA